MNLDIFSVLPLTAVTFSVFWRNLCFSNYAVGKRGNFCLFLVFVRLFGVRDFLHFLFEMFVAWIDIQVAVHALLGEITYLSLHCHHNDDSCIKMGSDENHFNV